MSQEKTDKELIEQFNLVLQDINETVNKKIKEGGLPKNTLFFIQNQDSKYPIIITAAFEVSGIKDRHEPS